MIISFSSQSSVGEKRAGACSAMALASTTPVLAVALVARIVIKEIRHKTM